MRKLFALLAIFGAMSIATPTWADDKPAAEATPAAAAPAAAAPAAAAPAAGGEGPPSEAAAAPPNSTLFVTNLPETTTDSMLSMLFQQFPGFSRTRMVPAKPGIAFVEFETEVAAGVAKSGLHGFKITPEKAMNVEYAKR